VSATSPARRGAGPVLLAIAAIAVALAAGAGIGLGVSRLVEHDDHKTSSPAGRQAASVLHAGRYTSRRFTPVRYFTIGQGWRVDVDTPALLEISRGGTPFGSIGFDLPRELLDDGSISYAEAASAGAKVRPVPDDVGAFFRSRPEFETSASTPTTVDGQPADSFTVRLKPLPPENRHLCGATRCIFYARNASQLFGLFENDTTEFTVVRVRNQTVLIAAAAPTQAFDEFRTIANQIVRTVRLRLR